MTPFSAIFGPLRALLLLLLVLVVMANGFSFYLRHEMKERRAWMSLLMAAVVLPVIPLLCPGDDPLYQFQARLPLIPVLMAILLLVTGTAVSFTGLIFQWKNLLTSFSVKEALEQMPVGLAYFDDQGRLVLCNRQMERLVALLTGRDLQMITDLQHGLLAPENGITVTPVKNIWRFPDGTAWRFASQEITDSEGITFTEWTASDMTEQEALRKDLHDRNAELQKMITRMKHISVRTADLVREQELLAAKVRVHHQMGSLLLTARRQLSLGLPANALPGLIRMWRDGLGSLQAEVESRDTVDAMEEVIRVAGNIGVSVEIQGRLPEQPQQRYLLAAALRECVTNTLRHAQGSIVHVELTCAHDTVCAVYTNNGTPPHGPIREGGGLSSLRKTIENAGGSMSISADSEFRLLLTLSAQTGDDEDR